MRLNLPFITLTLSVSCFLNMGRAQTLPQAVKLMLECEPELRATNSDSRSSYEQWKVSRAAGLPQISIDSSIGGTERDRATDGLVTNSTTSSLFSRQIGVSLRQLIFDGGTTRNLAEADLRSYEMQRYLQMSMLENRVVDLTEVYFEVFRTQEQIVLAQRNVDDHNSLLSKLKILEEGGDVKTNAELVLGRLNKALNRLDLQKLKNEEAVLRFQRLVCQKPVVSKMSKPSLVTPNVASCDSNWDLLAAQAALRSATHGAKAQGGLRVPQFYLDLGASRGEDSIGVAGSDNELRANLAISWDVFTGGSNKASQRLQRHQVEKAAELVIAARKNCEYESALIQSELSSAKKAQISFQAYSSRMENVIADYDEQFELGMQSLIDMLDVRNELYEAKTEAIDARYDVTAANARLLGKHGGLTSNLVGDYAVKKFNVCDTRSDAWVEKNSLSDEVVELYRAEKCESNCTDTPKVVEASVNVSPISDKNTFKGLFGKKRKGGIFKSK